LLAQRTAGQLIEKCLHPGQTRRQEPVTHEPPHGQAGHVTREFINLNHDATACDSKILAGSDRDHRMA
jgi:hypothetical protein